MGPEAIAERKALRMQETQQDTALVASQGEQQDLASQKDQRQQAIVETEKREMTAEEIWIVTKSKCAGSWKDACSSA